MNFKFLLLIFLLSFDTWGQANNTVTNVSELQLTFRTGLYKRFSLAVDLYANGNDDKVKKQSTQTGYKISLNYSLKSGYIYSFLFDKLQNYEIEEADTTTYHEYRYSFQIAKIYSFKRFSLNSRLRIEYRFIETALNEFVDVFRFRYKWGAILPINKKIIMKHVLYHFNGLEANFNSGSSVTGYNFFDKVNVNLGIGYCFTDNIRLELDYSFAYRIKSDAISKENIHTYNLSLIFNNLFSKRFAKGLF